MRKIVSMLLVIFIVFGSIGFCTDDFKLSGYQWISPEEAYITSNLIVPVSIIIGEEADLRISVYRRTDGYDSSEELLDMTDISNGIRLFEDDETYVIVKDNLFKDTISKKLTDAINIDAIDDEVVDSGIAENNFYDQNYRYYDNNLDKDADDNEDNNTLIDFEDEIIENSQYKMYSFFEEIGNLSVGQLGRFNYELSFYEPGEYVIYVCVLNLEEDMEVLERIVKIVDPEESKKYIDDYGKFLPDSEILLD